MPAVVLALAGAAVTAGLVFGPPLAWAVARRSERVVQGLALAIVLFLADIACVYAPTVWGATGMSWAWLGKTCEVLVFGVLYLAIARAEGPSRSPRGGLWIACALAVGVAVTIPGLFTLDPEPPKLPDRAYLIYQSTMPGVAEELVYRGLLLFVLDRTLGRPCQMLGVRWGWGAVLTTAVFYLGHALRFDDHRKLIIDFKAAIDFGVFGFAMCWLRYRFDSHWPSALAHNAHNCLSPYLAIGVHCLLSR